MPTLLFHPTVKASANLAENRGFTWCARIAPICIPSRILHDLCVEPFCDLRASRRTCTARWRAFRESFACCLLSCAMRRLLSSWASWCQGPAAALGRDNPSRHHISQTKHAVLVLLGSSQRQDFLKFPSALPAHGFAGSFAPTLAHPPATRLLPAPCMLRPPTRPPARSPTLLGHPKPACCKSARLD